MNYPVFSLFRGCKDNNFIFTLPNLFETFLELFSAAESVVVPHHRVERPQLQAQVLFRLPTEDLAKLLQALGIWHALRPTPPLGQPPVC